jgi:hypothetical protein
MSFIDQFPDTSSGTYVDYTTSLAVNRGMVIDFYHVPTGYSVAFKGMINSFSDQYSSEWNTEVVYGRMDPIAMFQGTARTISIEWDVVAASSKEAILNMAKCEQLMAMLYPTYATPEGAASNANQISSSPLFKFKFGNFAHDASKGPSSGARASAAGLTGFIGGFTFEPDFESGIIDCPESSPGAGDGQVGMFYPQKLTLSAEFTVLHTHDMGWKTDGSKPRWSETTGENSSDMGLATSGFPYTTPGSHMSGFEGVSGKGADGASGARANTPEGKTTEGTDPNDGDAQITGFALGLI